MKNNFFNKLWNINHTNVYFKLPYIIFLNNLNVILIQLTTHYFF